jgi:hypothetical protein
MLIFTWLDFVNIFLMWLLHIHCYSLLLTDLRSWRTPECSSRIARINPSTVGHNFFLWRFLSCCIGCIKETSLSQQVNANSQGDKPQSLKLGERGESVNHQLYFVYNTICEINIKLWFHSWTNLDLEKKITRHAVSATVDCTA